MEVFILLALVLLNGVFAMSEVALLTARKSRLEQLAKQGDGLAAAALRLQQDPTRFLSTVQIGITTVSIVNGIIGEAFFSDGLAAWLREHFAMQDRTSAVTATIVVVAVVTYLSIVLGELVPKRLGQHNAVGIAKVAAWPMLFLAKFTAPIVWVLSRSSNAILNPILSLYSRHGEVEGEMTPEEIRTILLEYSNLLPKKHLSILMNLFDLGDVTVEDIMVPRARIEAIVLEEGMETVSHKLSTSHHTRVPVFRDREGALAGVLHLRRILGPLHAGTLDETAVIEVLEDPYFVPASTSVLTQLQYFQENKARIALVVDEYGELMGLITLEDILEEIIGKFTTSLPSAAPLLAWDEDGAATADGAMPVREVNRALGLSLPTDGPKTLSGLIVEHLQDIPEADVSVRIGAVAMEIVHAQGRTVKTVRLFRPVESVETTEASEA